MSDNLTPGEEGLQAYLVEKLASLSPDAEAINEALITWAASSSPDEWLKRALATEEYREWAKEASTMQTLTAMQSTAALIDSVMSGARITARQLSDQDDIPLTTLTVAPALVATYASATAPLFAVFLDEVMKLRSAMRDISTGAEDLLKEEDNG